jgi:putative oxidoreductase
MLMIIDETPVANSRIEPLVYLVETGRGLIQQIASPSLVQLVMRVALSVPFWKSGS